MSRRLGVEGVGKGYLEGRTVRRVLDDVSLAVAPAEAVALKGPSGAGKTTLLRLIAGLDAPDEGRIRVFAGEQTIEVSASSENERARFRRHYVGFIFQFFNLVPTLSVAENVRLPLELAGREALADEALERLDALGLGDRRDALPGVLSGGEQQRVAIARALAHRPALVLADEPTGNLDAGNARNVADLLFDHARSTGAALLVATHSDAVAARADRIVALAP